MTPYQESFTFPEKKRNYRHKPLYTKEVLEPIVKQSHSVTDVLRFLGFCLVGNTHAWFTKKIKGLGIDTSHFYTKRQYNNLGGGRNKKDKSEYLRVYSVEERIPNGKILRRSLIESGREYKCDICGLLPEWNGKPLRIQVDHIDGNKLDNRIKNLRFLCPNCHTQTPTFCASNHIRQHEKSRCNECGNIISNGAKLCRKCLSIRKRERLAARGPKPERRKVQRPPKEEFQHLLDTMPMVKIGEKFGVSDNAIRKWAKDYGIELKKRIPKYHKSTKPKFKRTIVDGKTWCNVHKDWIAIENFTKDKNDSLGLFSCCRDCRKTQKGRSKKTAHGQDGNATACYAAQPSG